MTGTSVEMIRCAACEAVNRVPLDKLAQGRAPVCGRCKAPLSADKPVVVTDATFATDVEQSALPVLVDMWAPWCGPCRIIAPMVDQLAAEMFGRLRVAKVNVDENPVVSMRFNIQSIPALLVFKDGREVDRIIGAVPKAEIARRLEQWVR